MKTPEELQSKAIEETVKQVFGFVNDIIRPPAKQIGLFFEDKVKSWRFNNQLKIIRKAQKLIKENGINPNKVPIKFLAPLLENCSLEEDENMQDKWSSLLSNAVSGEKFSENFISYVELLRLISPLEAKFLDYIYEKLPIRIRLKEDDLPEYIYMRDFIDKMQLTDNEYHLIHDSLIRLNLINGETYFDESQLSVEEVKNFGQVSHTIKQGRIGFSKEIINFNSQSITLTNLGFDFVINCRKKVPNTDFEKVRIIFEDMYNEDFKQLESDHVQNFIQEVCNINPLFLRHDVWNSIRSGFGDVVGGIYPDLDFRRYEFKSNDKNQIIDNIIELLTKLYS